MDPNIPQPPLPPVNQSTNNYPQQPQSTAQPQIPQEVLSGGIPSVKSGRNKLILIIGISVVVISLGIGAFALLKNSKGNGSVSAGSGSGLLGGSPTKKYDKDIDNDGYPDFIEQAVGLDPAVSELTRCTSSNCANASLQDNQKIHNVLIILDGSGSMAAKVGAMARMDAAKAAIKNYVRQSAATTKIGFMVYGQAGSNSDKDKAVSCSSASLISPIGGITPANIDSNLLGVKPVGWTPMGYALQQALSQFSGKSGQNNEIILVSDGAESCNTNPVGAAAALKTAGVKVNIIAFAASFSELSSLQQIASAGGGTYASANSYEELDRKFNEQYENGLKLLDQGKCEGAAFESFTKCWSDAYNKIYKWITDTKMSFYDKKITQEEYNYLDDLSSKIFKMYQGESNRQLELYNKKASEINRQIQIRGE